MNPRIQKILHDMSALDRELRNALHEQEHRIFFELHGKKVVFEASVREAQRRARTGLVAWMRQSQVRSILSIPFIYALALPLLALDLAVTCYQGVCFRLYRIAMVERSDYIAIDRHHLAYLNSIEKLNCLYCSYANGLIAYVGEIAARTEQYWCPIKHAHKLLGTHARYGHFLPYGDGTAYAARLEEYRKALSVPS
jgi:hypothetical protein